MKPYKPHIWFEDGEWKMSFSRQADIRFYAPSVNEVCERFNRFIEKFGDTLLPKYRKPLKRQ